jgi:ABC-type nitrate/sulfonate/bicarbonate transport system substrate-binding protein
MKVMMQFIVLLVLAFSPAAIAKEDKTITKVVKLLQEMLEKSQEEGDEERKIYAKFKCYCDQSEAEKKESIEKLTDTISVL